MWGRSVTNSPASPSSAPREGDEGTEADAQAHRVPAWAPFRFPDYRLYWSGSVAAMFTNQLTILITTVWLFRETGSASQLGLIGVVQLFVQVPALLWGGTLADQVDRKMLMAATQGITAIVLALLALLIVGDALLPWHVYLAMAVMSVTTVLGSPARSALTAVVVPRTHLMHAVTMNTLTQQIGSIVAPLTFGFVAIQFGLTTVFMLTAITAIPSAIMPLMIRASGRPVGVTSTGSMPRRVWEGFRYMQGHPILPGLFILDIGMTVFTFYRQMVPALASGLFRGGDGAVSLLTTANSIGAAGGAFLVLFLTRYRPKGMLVVYATLGFSVAVFLFGTVTTLILGIVVITAMGALDAVTMTTRQAMMQLTTPDQMLGRTLSLGTLVATTANNLGTIWVGYLAGGLSIGAIELGGIGEARTMQLGGVLALICTVVVWRSMRALREYRYP